MANLKILKTRIKSVKSTQKITKAMKMVAASKLRRARNRAEAAAPYADAMERMLLALAGGAKGSASASPLLQGTGKDQVHLVIVATSDRGLCGAFNGSIVKAAKKQINELERKGKTVKVLCVGRKGYEQLRTLLGKRIIHIIEGIGKKQVAYAEAETITEYVLTQFAEGGFDVCTIIYNRFKSAIAQEVTLQQLIPLAVEEKETTSSAIYEYEPSEEAILTDLLPKNITVQIYHALLENAASEQGARMTAMDNASRNAGEMIKKLTLVYNRTRQATITKELIEIISGAEAL